MSGHNSKKYGELVVDEGSVIREMRRFKYVGCVVLKMRLQRKT